MRRRTFLAKASAFSLISCGPQTGMIGQPSADLGTLSGLDIKGFTLSSWGTQGLSQKADILEMLNYFEGCGSNTVQLNVQVNLDKQGNWVGFNNEGNRHAELNDLAARMNEISKRKMKLILKPTFASAGRAALRYEYQNSGFENQLTVALKDYIQTLDREIDINKFKMIVLPGELTAIDGGDQGRNIFGPMIEKIRSAFGGDLTYHPGLYSHDGSFHPKKIMFWDLLDFVSVSFYPRIHVGMEDSLSISQEQARNSVRIKRDFKNLINLSNKVSKKIYLAECGYPSHKFGLNLVNGWDPEKWGSRVDAVQAVGLDALFHNISKNAASFEGFSLWGHHGGTLQQKRLKHPNYEIEFATIGKQQSTEIIKNYLVI